MATIDRIRLKVERAKKHFQELDARCRAFYDTDPYGVHVKRDANTRELVYYVTKVDTVPLDISTIIGDVIQNLRSALDHLAHELVCIGRQSRGPFTYVYFPIADTAAEFEADLVRKVKGARQDAIDAIRNVKPYQGGNLALWRLHRLNIIDKHRLLLTVASAHRLHSITPSHRRTLQNIWRGSHGSDPFPAELAGDLFMRPTGNPSVLKIGDELLRIPESEAQQDMKFHLDVAFNELQILEGESVLEALDGMRNAVEKLLPDFAPLL